MRTLGINFGKTAAAGLTALSLLAIASSRPAHAQYAFTSLASSSTLSGISLFGNARLNNNGDVSFMGGATSLTSAAGAAYYIVPSGSSAQRAVGYGDTAPIGSTYSLINDQYYSFDNSRNIVFSSNVATGGTITTNNNNGLFVYNAASGVTSTVIQKGVSVLPNGDTAGSTGSYSASNGRIVVQEGAASTPTWQVDLYSYDASTKSNIALKGGSIPGSQFATFNTFTFATIDAAGGTSFFATGIGDPGTSQGIYAKAAGNSTITKIANFSDIAPAVGLTDPGFTQFSKVVRNTSNQNAFLGRVASTQDGSPVGTAEYGLWYYDPANGLTNLALAGQAAPGDGTFANSLGSYSLGNINESGTGVYLASGLGGTATSAVFSFTGATQSRLLAVGDSLFGSTVSGLGIPWINDSGSVAMSYTLSNGVSGVLLASVPTVGAAAPEPGSLALFSAALLPAAALSRRRRLVSRRKSSDNRNNTSPL